MNKPFISILLTGFLHLSAYAQDDAPLWMRAPHISPDGKEVAFSYMGNLYTVPVQGGVATQLTTDDAYDGYPIWSPSGKQIAFSSNREGGMDVYVMSAQGGKAQRATTHSLNEYPAAWTDEEHLLVRRAGNPTVSEITYPSNIFTRLYEVPVKGGRQILFSALSMENISIHPDGRILYQDLKGYEDPLRKHHTSSITRNIYMKKGDKYEQMTTFEGEDRNPVWAPDGKGYYYLSEQDGTLNIYHTTLGGSTQQLTHFKGNPVRSLSISNSGVLAFAYDGELYTMQAGEAPKKIALQIKSDLNPDRVVRSLMRSGASHVAVSPQGKEVAFILNGDVYVTTMDFATCKQITQTPERERRVDFRKDGRAIVYDSERQGFWSLYEAEIANDKESTMTYCTEVKETLLTDGVTTSFQPKYSPDGKWVAYLKNRDELCVMNLKSGKSHVVMSGKYSYSYADGDQYFTWSPDSKWLLTNYMGNGGWHNRDVALVPVDGKSEPVNLTQSGYTDAGAKWVMGGKAMIFFSDRAGYRSHGSWGSHRDVYITFFDQEAYNTFCMNKEDKSLWEENNKKKLEEAKKDTTAKVKSLELNLDNLDQRTLRLTTLSTDIADAVMNNEGTRLYYLAPHNGGMALWIQDLVEHRNELKMARIDAYELSVDASGKDCYFIGSGGNICKLNLQSASIKQIPFETTTLRQPAKTQAYYFEHIWRQTKEKLYDPCMNGAQWDSLYTTYKRFLPHINNGYDFAELASELLGELNVSHTGCRYRGSGSSMPVAELGALVDETYKGKGILLTEILPGGPLSIAPEIEAGSIITAIDEQEIGEGADFYPLLAGKAGAYTRLSVKGVKREIVIRPISWAKQQDMLYKRWVKRNEKMVDSLSGGKLAYVHIEAMNASSFHEFYKDLLAEKNRVRQAVIVDTRHNGGGWLHNDVCIALSGKAYSQYTPRDKFIGVDPFDRWTKPSCMLICEDNYSNAHGTPWLYKEMGIGKLIGTPVPGTMTAVWWETIGSYTFGIPEVGTRDRKGNYLENQQLYPDVTCYITPEDLLAGQDTQLQVAVSEMLKQVESGTEK